jgi:hypothetical protein
MKHLDASSERVGHRAPPPALENRGRKYTSAPYSFAPLRWVANGVRLLGLDRKVEPLFWLFDLPKNQKF